MADPIDSLGFVPGQNLDDKLFDPAELAAAETLLQQYLADNFPTLKLDRSSTLFDLIIRPRAVSYMLSRAEWTALRATQSLKGVVDNPELASAAIVDAILSNDLITRRLGSKAIGRVRVTVSDDRVYSIPSDMTFETTEGLVFSPRMSYRATSAPGQEDELKLYSSDQGQQFYFLVPVIAAENGVKYQLANTTPVVPAPSIPNLISAAAFGNFQNGSDDESNEALIARIPEGKSVKNQVSSLAIRATLKDAFPDLLDVSVQGMNGIAMTRNAHNLMGLKTGGFADIYVRTAAGLSVGEVQKSATLIEIGEDKNAIYRVALTREDFPGHYFVKGISPAGLDILGSYQVLSETKDFDNRVDLNGEALGTSRPNKIVTIQEAVYSRFQNNTVLFVVEYDESLGNSPEDQFAQTIAVDVEVSYLPLIKNIQEFVSDRERGVIVADYLVRAAVPCLVQLSTLNVEAKLNTDPAEVRLAIYNYINGLKMGDRLRVDEILSAAKSVTGVKFVQLPIRLTGSIYSPDGTILSISGDSFLKIPSLPVPQVVPENTAFFIELPDIPVNLIES